MRHVTVCESLGPRKVPGSNHDQKYELYQLQPGTAWEINDVSRDHHVIEVSKKICEAAKYLWELRWIDGRTVAVFGVVDTQLAQPVIDDPRAKDRRLGSSHKKRKPRREAPGVAPEAAGEPDDEPRSRRTRKETTEGANPPKRSKILVRKHRTLEPL